MPPIEWKYSKFFSDSRTFMRKHSSGSDSVRTPVGRERALGIVLGIPSQLAAIQKIRNQNAIRHCNRSNLGTVDSHEMRKPKTGLRRRSTEEAFWARVNRSWRRVSPTVTGSPMMLKLMSVSKRGSNSPRGPRFIPRLFVIKEIGMPVQLAKAFSRLSIVE